MTAHLVDAPQDGSTMIDEHCARRCCANAARFANEQLSAQAGFQAAQSMAGAGHRHVRPFRGHCETATIDAQDGKPDRHQVNTGKVHAAKDFICGAV